MREKQAGFGCRDTGLMALPLPSWACTQWRHGPGREHETTSSQENLGATSRAGRRPRILIEDDQPALAISDFSMFEQAGFDVAVCSGPGGDLAACPVLHGRPCPVLTGAGAVLHGLDPALGVAAAIGRQSPGVPLVVEQRRRADGCPQPVPEGCLPLAFPCSVRGRSMRCGAHLRSNEGRFCACIIPYQPT